MYPDLQLSAMGGRQSRLHPAQPDSTEDIPAKIELGDFAVDEYKPIKVVVIGAGFSGILAGDRKSTRLNSSHSGESRMPSSA